MTELPTRFGKYELLERIATGGMAEVFLARSFGVEGFEKRLVVKRIRPELAKSARFVQMFIQEAKISAGLHHPNIVQIFELGRVADDHYIAMEYVHGRDLTRVIKTLRRNGERIPMPLALEIAANLLRGLGYAHARTDPQGDLLNLVHRDVSPHNVMVGFQGEVKLFDFGIARIMRAGEGDTQKPGGGKYAYMSPEQAQGGAIDGRSDLYSAGIVLYEMLVGHRLFDHPDPDEKLRMVREARVPDIRNEVPQVPTKVWDVLKWLLHKEPDARPATAQEAETAVREAMFDEGFRADQGLLAAFMTQVFPEERGREPGVSHLEALVADLTRLDGTTQLTGSDPGTGSHSTATHHPEVESLVKAAPGERKPVVVMVGEVCGFTDPSYRVDSEKLVRWHYKLLRRVRRVVGKYDGVVDRYQDDTFVIFFGVPRADEHDLERALVCAVELQRVARSLRRKGLLVDLSIGVHRGEISVGRRQGRSFRYVAAGDTMKLASRLAVEADVGQVVVSDTVAALAGDRWRLDRGGRIRMKGHREERRYFRVLARRTREQRAGGNWLRRKGELDTIRDALTELADDGGGVLHVQGDAGMGKSRLLREVVDLAKRNRVPLYVGRALPFDTGRPLAPLRELLSHAVGVDGSAPREDVQRGLERLAQLGISEHDREIVRGIFGIAEGFAPSQDAILGAFGRVVHALARERPVIFVVEDVQHLDGLERRILAHAVSHARQVPALFWLSSREALPADFPRPRHRIDLEQLSADEAEGLIAEILGVPMVSSGLRDVVQRTAEGNPLYIEEVLKALRQDERLEVSESRAQLKSLSDAEDGARPLGLEGLLASRVDALGAASKGALQVAAVVGLRFDAALLAEALGLESPDALLGDLVEHGLIVDRGDGHYRFASELLWQAVLHSILGVQRRDYHRMVLEAMLRLYGDDLDDQRLALGQHYAEAKQYLEAARQASMAGDRLRRGQFLERAHAAWELGIKWIVRAEQEGEDGLACRLGEALLRLKTGEVVALLGAPSRAMRHLQLALDLADELQDTEIEHRALLALGRLYSAQGKAMLARMNLEAAADAPASEPWARDVAVQALETLGMILHEHGETDAADARFREALERAGDDDALAGRAVLGLANRQIREGNQARAQELLEEARAHAEAAGDRILLGRVVNNLGIVYHNEGRHDDALEAFRTAMEIREGVGYRTGVVVNLHNIGDIHLRRGELSKAYDAFVQSREMAEASNWPRGVLINEAYIAYLEGIRDHGTGAIERMRAAVERVQGELDEPEILITAHWLFGRLLRKLGHDEEGKGVLLEALEMAEEVGSAHHAQELRLALT